MATIQKRKNQTYTARIRRSGFPEISYTAGTKKEAEEWATNKEAEMIRGEFKDTREAEKNSFGHILKRYLEEVAPYHKGNESEELRIKALMRDKIAEYTMINLNAAALTEYITRRREKVQDSTVRRELDLISQVIVKARRTWGINIPENPVTLIDRPKPAQARSRRLEINEESYLNAILTKEDKRRNPLVAPFFRFAIATAMRRGEALKLEWKYVSLEQKSAFLPETKNGDSRDVPLSKTARTILEDLKKVQTAPIEPGGPHRELTGKVFPITADAIKKAWSRAKIAARKQYEQDCESKGIRPSPTFLINIRVHDLRHEAATRMASKIKNPLDLAAITGHKDLHSLKRYYNPRANELAEMLDS